MTRSLSRLRRWRRPADAPLDPTRPGPVIIHDGVAIAHEGPPGYPGPLPRPEVEDPADR